MSLHYYFIYKLCVVPHTIDLIQFQSIITMPLASVKLRVSIPFTIIWSLKQQLFIGYFHKQNHNKFTMNFLVRKPQISYFNFLIFISTFVYNLIICSTNKLSFKNTQPTLVCQIQHNNVHTVHMYGYRKTYTSNDIPMNEIVVPSGIIFNT